MHHQHCRTGYRHPTSDFLTVNKSNYTHGMIERTGEFNVSILSEKASFDTFKHFGFQSGRDVDKFDGYTTAKRADNGIFYITEGTNAYISAKVVQSVDLGTHTMFIADVVAGEKLSDDPSTTYTYYQKNIKPAPAAPKTGKVTWVCQVCGYVYEGEELPADFICPLCNMERQILKRLFLRHNAKGEELLVLPLFFRLSVHSSYMFRFSQVMFAKQKISTSSLHNFLEYSRL